VYITLLHPNKTDVLPFLDGNASAPGRYARATVQTGATNSSSPYWQEYMVGPLTDANSSNVEPLTFPFQNKQPGRTRVDSVMSPNEFGMYLTKFAKEHDDIWQRLFNSVSGGSADYSENVAHINLVIPRWNRRSSSWNSVLGRWPCRLLDVRVFRPRYQPQQCNGSATRVLHQV